MTAESRSVLWLSSLLLALLVWPVSTGAATTDEASPLRAEEPTTRLELKVKGCEGCKVQPIQNTDGAISYAGKTKTRPRRCGGIHRPDISDTADGLPGLRTLR